MKKRIFSVVFSLLISLSGLFLLTSCGEKNYNITFDFDISKVNVYYLGTEGKVFNTKNLKSETLYGYDIFDYSELKVLVNGVENNEIITNNGYQPDTIAGYTFPVCTLDFTKLKSDSHIELTGIKERKVEIGFIDAKDVRLADDVYEENAYDEEEKAELQQHYTDMYYDFGQNLKIKISDNDYSKLKETYPSAQRDEFGYIDAQYLFIDDTETILYEVPDEPAVEGEETESTPVYSPYFFTFNASDLFNPIFETITYLPNGESKEGMYQQCNYTSDGAFLSMLSTQGYNNYSFADYSFAKNYNFNYSTSQTESIAGNITSNLYSSEYFITQQELIESNDDESLLYQYTKFKLNLNSKNLIVFNFAHMNVNTLTIENDYAFLNDNSTTSTSLTLPVNEPRTIKLVNLGNVSGHNNISGVDYSTAKLYINGTELSRPLGNYTYISANPETDEQEHFELTLNANILPIHFYTPEQLRDKSLTKNLSNYYLTYNNIDFSNIIGASLFKVYSTIETDFNIHEYADLSTNGLVYSWTEDETLLAYVGSTPQHTVDGDPYPYVTATFQNSLNNELPNIIVKKDNEEIVNVDVVTKANELLSQGLTELDYAVSWAEGNVEISLTFYNIDSGVFEGNCLSSISIIIQNDAETEVWEIIMS